jgi:hypothetical protein
MAETQFGREDYCLDHAMYINNNRCNCVASLLCWSFFENPNERVHQEKCYKTYETEGVQKDTR